MADSGKVSLRPRGRFNAETTYERLDMVKYGSGLYIAIQTTTGNLPTDTLNWMNAMEYNIANMSQVGLVKPDGISTTIAADGTLHANVSAGVSSFNYRDGDVIPATGDYTAAMIGYDNSDSSLDAVNVKDAIDELDSKKTDTSVIAPVESGSTASKAYVIGEHFIRDNAFCTAIAAIAEGASFTLNTNYTAESIGDVISALNSDLAYLKTYDSSTITDLQSMSGTYNNYVRRIGNTVSLAFGGHFSTPLTGVNLTTNFGRVPEGYRPTQEVRTIGYYATTTSEAYNNVMDFAIRTDGYIRQTMTNSGTIGRFNIYIPSYGITL